MNRESRSSYTPRNAEGSAGRQASESDPRGNPSGRSCCCFPTIHNTTKFHCEVLADVLFYTFSIVHSREVPYLKIFEITGARSGLLCLAFYTKELRTALPPASTAREPKTAFTRSRSRANRMYPPPKTRASVTYTRNARASTTPRSMGFCVIWDCISSSSSSLADTTRTSRIGATRRFALSSKSTSLPHPFLFSGNTHRHRPSTLVEHRRQLQ